jgi:hypothetical protein
MEEEARGGWKGIKNFLDRPFGADMDFIDWFMFIGLILVIMIIWHIILRHIAEAV